MLSNVFNFTDNLNGALCHNMNQNTLPGEGAPHEIVCLCLTSNSELNLFNVSLITLAWHLVPMHIITHSKEKGVSMSECGIKATQYWVDVSRGSPVRLWTEGYITLGGFITWRGTYLPTWQWVNNSFTDFPLHSGIHNMY